MDLDQAQTILDTAHTAFVSMDQHGRITYWNAAAEAIFGLSRDQVQGEVLAETIIPERYRRAHAEGLERFLSSGEGPVLNKRIELSGMRSDGSEFPIEITISALAEGERWSFHAFIADIAERHRARDESERLLDEVQHALAGTEQRLAVIVDSLAEAVTIRGADNHVVYANRPALERLGLTSVDELRQADPRILMEGYEAFGESGEEILMDDLPSVKLLKGEDPEPLMLRSINRMSGEEEWVLLKASAVRDSDGQIEAAVTIIEDVTAAKRASLRMEFLAQAGQILAASLDYQQTLKNVAGLAVPHIADWCAVDLFDEEGDREPVAVAHVDPSKLRTAERLRAYEPEHLDPDQGLGLVRSTGESVLYGEIPDELLVHAAVDEEHLSLLRAVGMRSVLIVPMKGRSRTIGALTMVSAESGRSFNDEDLEFAQQIAERAALAVENARLYSQRSEVALTLQESLLPETLPQIAGWEITALYRPAGHGSEVGGDFYDFWQAGGDWLMTVGDVTGKGVSAAAVTSLVRHTAWVASEFDPRPAQILAHIDRALKQRPGLSICTALCLRISNERVTIAAGGHPLPLLIGESGVQQVGAHGTLLGAFASATWPEVEFELAAGETLVAITDGVTDAVGEGGTRFGTERLTSTLAAAPDEPPTAIRERLVRALEEFQVGAQADDTALVIMRHIGASSGEEDDQVHGQAHAL